MIASIMLGITLLKRQWHGYMLSLLSFSFILCIALMSGISILGARLHLVMEQQASTLMGADLIMSSSQPIRQDVVNKADSLGLKHTTLVEFLTMTLHQDTPVLAMVKAVTSPYPLIGALDVSMSSTDPIPKKGDIWLHADWRDRFGIKKQDVITIGDVSFTVTHFIEKEPEVGANVFNIAPRIIMNQADLNATGVIGPGSRVEYRLQMVGDANKLSDFSAWVKPTLSVHEKLIDFKEDRPELSKTIDRAERYLIFIAFSSIILAGTTILLVLREYARAQERTVSLLRTFGVARRQLFEIYLGSLLLIGLLVGLIGTALGYCLQLIIASVLAFKFGIVLPAADGLSNGVGIATALILMIGFSMPYLSDLVKQSPLAIFHRQTTTFVKTNVLFATSISATLLIILVIFTKNLTFSATTLFTAITLYILSYAALDMMLRALQRLKPFFKGPYKLSLSRLVLYKTETIAQILGLSLSLTLILLLVFVRYDLLSQWQESFPENPPNYFIYNILPDESNALASLLSANDIDHTEFFPIVKARLIGFTDFPPGETPNFLKRELNNTALDNPRPIDSIIQGQWWEPTTDEHVVSVERSIAETLNLKIGQTLHFKTADKEFSAKIANIREVEWENFQPNFYMIFSSATFDHFPRTYLSSMHLAADKSILPKISKNFPSVTVISVADVLSEVQRVIKQSSQYMTLLLSVVLLTCIMLVATTTTIQLQSRLKESLILKRLGVLKRQQLMALMTENLLTSFLAAGFSYAVATSMIFFAGKTVFQSAGAHLPIIYFPLSLMFVLIIQAIAGRRITASVR